MTTVTREHKAGLELALSELKGDLHQYESFGDVLLVVEKLIAQASAAPEQEPAAYSYWQLIHDSMGGWESRITKHDPRKNQFIKAEDLKGVEPLYTHPSAEIERLRSALQHIVKTVGQSRSSTRRLRWIEQRAIWALEGREYDNSQFDLPKNAGNTAERATQDARRVREQLIKAQALLAICGAPVRAQISRLEEESKRSNHPRLYREEAVKLTQALLDLDAFLSATDQPAEVKS